MLSFRTSVLQGREHVRTKADVLKVETLNVRGMARNHHLALSVADAGMSRLVTFCEYKADWRGRQVEKIDPWFPGSQTCSGCGEVHREMKNLKERMMRCDCGSVMGRDRNAAVTPAGFFRAGTAAPGRAGFGRHLPGQSQFHYCRAMKPMILNSCCADSGIGDISSAWGRPAVRHLVGQARGQSDHRHQPHRWRLSGAPWRSDRGRSGCIGESVPGTLGAGHVQRPIRFPITP